ncbi:MAG: hypothetical protein ACW98F_09430, partial [Candidatus Hodarchaeales archaeon]
SKYRFDRNDADLDSLPNYYEFRYGLDPSSDDTSLDLEADGVTNIEEFIAGTNPLMSDTDGDLFSDWAEDLFGSSSLNASDLPIIDNPVIVPLVLDTTILDNQTIDLRWRAAAQIKESYSIYANDTLLTQENWEQELIQYTFNPQIPGNWEITCVVIDDQGLSVQSTIWINVQRAKSPEITLFFVPWLSLLILIIAIRIKSRKK